jgi:hypothetical protein
MEVALHARRFVPLVAALALTALAVPSAARADDQFCYGDISPIAATPDRETGVNYEFTCRNAINGYVISSSRKLAAFDAAADVFDPGADGAIRGDDRFNECVGALPSFGFSCAGVNSGFGRFTRATFDTDKDPCGRDAARHLGLNVALVVEGLDGKLAGPFELGTPKGCAKPAKKPKAKQHAKH